MVVPPVLKRRHSLIGKNHLPLLVALKANHVPKEFARMTAETPLDEDQLEEAFNSLTGERATQILSLADRENNLQNLRLLIHFTILKANEVGQSNGQELVSSILLYCRILREALLPNYVKV